MGHVELTAVSVAPTKNGVRANGKDSGGGPIVMEESLIEKSSSITFHGINYEVDVKTKPCAKAEPKKILRDVSGIFKPGMNAIMGPTGSGKTSLLDVIAGRKDPRGLSGCLLVDGNKQPDNFKCMTGYVVQDDVVMGTLTIRENIMFSANLRLPTHLSKDEKADRVSNLLHELGLSHCADSKVGNEFIRGISGGERKRTNIGMELIISPPVLFLDEPTTGLDASTANAVMKLLHKLSRKGRTIIFSIHQPRYSIFKLFDNLMLLARGYPVYHGPSEDALHYFSSIGYICEEHNNPPDFFLDVINGDSTSVISQVDVEDNAEKRARSASSVTVEPDEQNLATTLNEQYTQSALYKQLKNEIDPVEASFMEKVQSGTATEVRGGQYATSFCTQFGIVSQRAILNIFRNPQTSIVQMGITAVFGAIVGLIYLQLDNVMPAAIQDRIGALFFIIMNQIFSNLSAIELFIKERAIFVHENTSGFYRVSAYFCAKLMCDIVPLRLIPTLIFSSICYFMIGLRADVGKFFFFYLTLFLTTTAASAIGFLMSASFRVFAIANLMSALTYVLMMIFSGLLVNLERMANWLSWLQYLSIFRYSLNALSINELKDLETCLPSINGTAGLCDRTTGNVYLATQGIKFDTDWDLWVNVLALFLIGMGFMVFTWIKLVCMKKLK